MSLDGSNGKATVDAGEMEFRPGFAQFVDIYLSAVKASVIVEDGSHKLQKIIRFEKKALVTLSGKGGAVRFVETVSGKELSRLSII